MKIVELIVVLVLLAPAFYLIRERYRFLLEKRQKAIAWLLGLVSGLVGLGCYWTILALVQSDKYEWLISDLCFLGFIYLYSYIINVYSAKCTRNLHDKILIDIENYLNENMRDGDCLYCGKKQEKLKLHWDYSKADKVQSADDLKAAIVVDGACCARDFEEIKDIAFNLYLAHMQDKVQKVPTID